MIFSPIFIFSHLFIWLLSCFLRLALIVRWVISLEMTFCRFLLDCCNRSCKAEALLWNLLMSALLRCFLLMNRIFWKIIIGFSLKMILLFLSHTTLIINYTSLYHCKKNYSFFHKSIEIIISGTILTKCFGCIAFS